MKMSVCWVILILLGCTSSRASQPRNACACNEEPRAGCEPSRAHVRVPCPNATATDMRFNLVRGRQVISNVTCSRENKTLNCGPAHRAAVPKTEKDSISFILTESSEGTYSCEGEVRFPPPFKRVPSEVKVQVVKVRQCKSADGKGETPGRDLVWVWIAVVSLLTVYSAAVTVAACVVWIKLRKADSQSDYINTKPRAPRDRKKRGVQNPIPRHF